MTINVTERPPKLKQTKSWGQPWGWRHALLIQLALLIVAEIVQIRWMQTHSPSILPPWNWILPASLVVVAGVVGAAFRRQAWMRWLSGVQFAVCAIAIIAALGLLGILVSQGEPPTVAPLPETVHNLAIAQAVRQFLTTLNSTITGLGLRAMFTSLPFVTAILLMMLNLSLVVGRRLVTPRPGLFGFMLNHVGLLLVAGGMIAGTAQFVNPRLVLKAGESTSTAGISQMNEATYDLGATITLQKFEIEKYPPKLAMVDYSRSMETPAVVYDTDWVAKGHALRAFGLLVTVLDYYPKAMPTDMQHTSSAWEPTSSHGLPAAHVLVTGAGVKKDLWVAAGVEALGIPSFFADIDNTHRLALMEPQPKAYRSYLTIQQGNSKPVERIVAVNQPVKIGNWSLYQSSYEQSMEGTYTILQAVRDPAMPVVYTGLVCMMLGSIIALWLTPRRRREPEPPAEQHETIEIAKAAEATE